LCYVFHRQDGSETVNETIHLERKYIMQSLGWVLLALGAIGFLNGVASNPRVPPVWRFVSSELEGDIWQDMTTGLYWRF
jgi:hypothetical protein